MEVYEHESGYDFFSHHHWSLSSLIFHIRYVCRISWFLETFTVMQISIVFTVLILYYGKILMHSNPFIIYIFLVCFSLSTIAFSFFLRYVRGLDYFCVEWVTVSIMISFCSVFFSKANVAAAAGGILFFCTFMPYSLLVLWEDRIS